MNTLKFIVIGIGRFGKHYIRLVNDIPETELVQTADSSSNLEELLVSEEIDCAVIATPASTHFEIATQVLTAGKHVLLEKPMVLGVEDAQTLDLLVQKSGKTFMVGHQYVYNDYIRHLKTIIDEGTLGKVSLISGKHLYPGPVREDIGTFWDAAPHELAIVDYIYGPLKVESVNGTATKNEAHEYDDSVAVEILFENELILNLNFSSVALKKIREIEFVGHKGQAIYNDLDPEFRLRVNDEGLRVDAGEPLRNQVEHFVDCVKNNKTPLTNIKHGTRVVRTLEKIARELGIILKKA